MQPSMAACFPHFSLFVLLLLLRAYPSAYWFLSREIATRRYFSGVERVPEHIPVVIFVSCSVTSSVFGRSSVFPRDYLRCILGPCGRYFRLILPREVRNKLRTIENAPSKVPCMDGRVVWFPQVNLPMRSDQLIGLICIGILV